MSANQAAAALLDAVTELVRTHLSPIVNAIDRDGRYPANFLGKLADAGGFAAAVPRHYGGLELGHATQLNVTCEVGRECGSTSFLVWCQSTCAHYLLRAPNETVRERYLTAVATGRLLAGTGMSNTVKHLASIENIHLKARRDGDGYRVSGALPWVSNLGDTHLAIVAASVEDRGYVMFALRGDAPGVSLHPCPEFAGLEGTRTLNIRLRDVHIADEDVLAHPEQFSAYIARIKPGFVLGQAGMGFGIVQGALRTIRDSNVASGHVNRFLDDQGDDLAGELAALQAHARILAAQADEGAASVLDVLRLRAATSELTLRAANSAVLHAGAKGYLLRHPAQRRLREAVFVAIVTPALKHLRKEIHALEQIGLQAQAA